MASHAAQFGGGIRSLRDRGGRIRDRWKPREVRAPSLDWLNFLIADVRGGLGPYIVVFLVTDLGWTPSATGFVTAIGGWLGLAAQGPLGAWLDRTSRKRAMLLWGLLGLSMGAITLVWVPSFWPAMAANGLMQIASGVFEPAVAALTVGLCARSALTARMGRNAAWSRAGNIAAALLSSFVAWLFSARAVFLQVPFVAAVAATVAMTIPQSKVDLRRARGLAGGDAEKDQPVRAMSLLRSRALITFAACSFLYELADAPLLTLVGQKLGSDRPGNGILFTSMLIIASQFGMLMSSVFVGRRADVIGYRPLIVLSFVMLPVQAAVTALTNEPSHLISIQVFGGLGTGLFAALTPIWLADETRGTGRYNLSQGLMATMRALGVTTSGLASELLVEHFGYSAAFLACGVVGSAAVTLSWLGLPGPSRGAVTAA